jgi:6-phosphogluconolactonase
VDCPGVEWDKWWVLFSDERMVPLAHDDSNYKACKDHFLGRVPVPEEHILKVNPDMSPDAAAADYQAQLLAVYGLPPNSHEVWHRV